MEDICLMNVNTAMNSRSINFLIVEIELYSKCLFQVMGLPRKRNYSGRWDVLIDKSTKCLNRLLEVAARKKRNYILDQVMFRCNVPFFICPNR